MKFENTKVTGLENAIIGARLPMCLSFHEAKEKCDSLFYIDGSPMEIGSDDLRVLKNLVKADSIKGKTGSPNAKFLRMVTVQVCISAPLYFFQELDTYKVGTVRNSSSVQHKGMSRHLTMDDFTIDNKILIGKVMAVIIKVLNHLIDRYKETKDYKYFKAFRQILPQSYNYTAMYQCNYETLRNIAAWRSKHKLSEWNKEFMDWIKTLPYAAELILENNNDC